jgi:hypothetical protein
LIRLDPPNVSEELTNCSVIASRHLQLNDYESSCPIDSKDVDKPAPRRKLYARDSLFLIKLEAGFEQGKILGQEVS